MDKQINGRTDEWTDRWIDGRTDGQMDKQTWTSSELNPSSIFILLLMAAFNDVCLPCFVSPLKPQRVTLWISGAGASPATLGSTSALITFQRKAPAFVTACFLPVMKSVWVCLFVRAVRDACRPKTSQVCCFLSRQDVQRLSIESSGKTLLSDFDLSSLYPMRWLCVSVCLPSCDQGTDSKWLDFITITINAKSCPIKSWCVWHHRRLPSLKSVTPWLNVKTKPGPVVCIWKRRPLFPACTRSWKKEDHP